VYWLSYSGDFDFGPFQNTKVEAFYDGYGLTADITGGPASQWIQSFSQMTSKLLSVSKGLVMQVQASFVTKGFNGNSSPFCPRDNGALYQLSIDVFNSVSPRPVLAFLTQAEWQEGKVIEPCSCWSDDQSTDPYKYHKLLASGIAGVPFVEPPLPPVQAVDPLRAGIVYGQAASFQNCTIPKNITANGSFEVSISFANTGAACWSFGQSLVGDSLIGSYALSVSAGWGLTAVNLLHADLIMNGQSKLFNFNVTAPDTAGSYKLNLQMQQYGFRFFGEEATFAVQVN